MLEKLKVHNMNIVLNVLSTYIVRVLLATLKNSRIYEPYLKERRTYLQRCHNCKLFHNSQKNYKEKRRCSLFK